jgi:hypothetical protein
MTDSNTLENTPFWSWIAATLESMPFEWLIVFALAVTMFGLLHQRTIRDRDNLPLEYNPTAAALVVMSYVFVYLALATAFYVWGTLIAQFLPPLPYVKSLADQMTASAALIVFLILGIFWQTSFIRYIDSAFVIWLHAQLRQSRKIFVNYRRDDDPSAAGRLRDGLAAKFGRSNLFMDVDNLLAGQRFDQQLATALEECDVLVSVIGPHWMELFKRKIASNQHDYVREEIAEALKRHIGIIPVRVGREGQMLLMPEPGEFPDDIRELAFYQKQDVAHENFGRDFEMLVEAIRVLRKSMQPKRRIAWVEILGVAIILIALLWLASRLFGSL